MKVLLVGEGAREHAIASAICRSPQGPRLYAAMRSMNPGIRELCLRSGGDVALGDSMDPEFISKAADRFSVDFVFIGPEEPLFRGAANAVEDMGIPCIGARREAAEIEMSKAFMRRLMWRHKIPGRLRFQAFRSIEDAIAYIEEYAESVAIKPARQAGGKGVKVIADFQAYLSKEKGHVKAEHAKAIEAKYMKGYADIEDRILIEERVEGPEYTIQMFTDGDSVAPFPLVQDNKNAYDMDIGPETGGMGSISGNGMLLPFITREEYDASVDIVRRCVKAIESELGVKYKGVISGQMMLTPIWGPTIIEFYSRFGDPEGVNVLPLLRTDMVEIMEAIASAKLHKVKMEFEEAATVVKCFAPKGYPERRDLAAGHPVRIDAEAIRAMGCEVFYGSVDLAQDGGLITGGSRICEIFAKGEEIPEISDRIERCSPLIYCLDGWGVFHRSDIGSAALLSRRIEQSNLIRDVYKYRMGKGLIGMDIDWIPGKGKIVHSVW